MENLVQKAKKYCAAVGLTENETKCYVTCLKLGPSSVQEIAKELQIFRSSAYALLNNLIKKGLISQQVSKRGRIIVSESPNRLLQLIRNEQRQLKRFELELANDLPEFLAALKQSKIRPTVRLYEDLEGLKAIHDDILAVGQTIYCYPRLDLSLTILPVEFQIEWIKQRVAKGIRTKAIVTDTLEAHELIKKTKTQEAPDALREIRFLPSHIRLSSEKIIYGDKIALLSYKKKISGIVIEHEELVTMELQLFELLWGMLEPNK